MKIVFANVFIAVSLVCEAKRFEEGDNAEIFVLFQLDSQVFEVYLQLDLQIQNIAQPKFQSARQKVYFSDHDIKMILPLSEVLGGMFLVNYQREKLLISCFGLHNQFQLVWVGSGKVVLFEKVC